VILIFGHILSLAVEPHNENKIDPHQPSIFHRNGIAYFFVLLIIRRLQAPTQNKDYTKPHFLWSISFIISIDYQTIHKHSMTTIHMLFSFTPF